VEFYFHAYTLHGALVTQKDNIEEYHLLGYDAV
jgi:hypothetical protein